MYNALGDLRNVSLGPSYRTQMMYRYDSITLRLKCDGISLKETTELTKQKKEIEDIFEIVTEEGDKAVSIGQKITLPLLR